MTVYFEVWSAPMAHRLVQLLASNKLSFAGIADAINKEFGTEFTRNACIGKARRLSQPARQKPYLRGSRPPARVDAPIPPKPKPRPTKPRPTGIDIYQLGYGDCRWPLADIHEHPPYQYCGAAAMVGTSWCPVHAKKVFGIPRPREEK